MHKRERLDTTDSGSDTGGTASSPGSYSHISRRGWRPETEETSEKQTIIDEYKAVVSEHKGKALKANNDLQDLIKSVTGTDTEFIAILQDDKKYIP